MATFELPVPAPFNSVNFVPVFRQQISAQASGMIQAFDRMTPGWMAEFQTPELRDDRLRSFEAFLDGLDGARNSFLAYDPRKMLPYAYRHYPLESTPWGLPTVQAYVSGNGQLTMQGGTPDAYITLGDMISVKVGNMWLLFRIQNNGQFNGSGIFTAVVKPRLTVNIPAGTAIRYIRPCAEMKIIGPVEKRDSVESIGPSFSFKAFQMYNRAA